MQQNSGKGARLAFNISMTTMIAAAILSASVLSGCSGGSDGDTKETRIVTETQISTRIVDGVYVDDEGNTIVSTTAPATKAEDSKDKEKASEKSENEAGGNSGGTGNSDGGGDGANNNSDSNNTNNGGGSNGGNSDNSAKSGTGESVGKITGKGGELVSDNQKTEDRRSNSEENPVADNSGYDSSNKTLNIEGKQYSIGDTVTCTYYLTCPEKLINFQGFIDFDGKCLEVIDAENSGPAASGSMANADNNKQRIYFNGSKLSGYKYANGGEFLTVTYKVVGGGEASPLFTWEVVSDMDTNSVLKSNILDLSYTYN